MSILVCSLGLAAQAAAVAAPTEMREVVATGDLVPRLGRIGQFGINLIGFDDRGRLLLSGQISDGRHGIFWADINNPTPLWTVGEPRRNPILLNGAFARSSPSGQFALALGAVDASDPLINETDALFLLRDRDPILRIARDDLTDNGDRLCSFELFLGGAVNDSATLAFFGEAVAPTHSCDDLDDPDPNDPNYVPTELIQGIWRAREGRIERVASIGEMLLGEEVPDLHLLGVARDGAVIFQAGSSIYAHANETRIVLRSGDHGPGGGELTDIQPLAINGSGDVLFFATEVGSNGLYRTDHGQLRRVQGWPLPALSGFYLYPEREPASLNDAGDVTLSGHWFELTPDAPGREIYGVVVFPTSGGVDLIREAGFARVNSRGEIAYATVRSGSAISVTRRSHGRDQLVVSDGDPVPGGGYFGAQGFGNSVCLDESGLVGATAYSTDSTGGIVCAGEDGGPTLIAKDGDPAPDGGVFESIGSCAFGADSEMFFTASKNEMGNSHASLYRATATGIEPVIPQDDPGAPDASTEIYGYQANSNGTVVVRANTSRGRAFLRRRRGGLLESLWIDEYTFPDSRTIERIQAFALADDDRIVATVRFRNERELRSPDEATSIVVFGDQEAKIIATRDDPALTGGPYDEIGPLVVGGELVVIHTDRFGSDRIFLYDLATQGAPREVFGESTGLDKGTVLDVTRTGDLLLYARDRSASFGASRYLLAGGSLVRLSEDGLAAADPLAINDRGNILYFRSRSTLGGYPWSLSISGPTVTARCLGQSTTSGSRDGGGCAIGTGHQPNAWMLVVPPLIFVARRRRPNASCQPTAVLSRALRAPG